VTSLVNLASAALGNPYPSCIYIGHSAYKAMGARSGYLFLAMVPCFGFSMLHGAALLQDLPLPPPHPDPYPHPHPHPVPVPVPVPVPLPLPLHIPLPPPLHPHPNPKPGCRASSRSSRASAS